MLAKRRTTSPCLRLPSTSHISYPTYPRNYLTSSSTRGPTDVPLANETLFDYFNNHILAQHSTRPALICRKELARAHGGSSSRNLNSAGVAHLAWDFEQFNHHIQAVARGLVALGVKKGDRVGVIMGNNSAYACLQWACASIGAILVTLNPAYRLKELTSTLTLSGVEHLFVVPRVRASNYVTMLASAFPDLAHSQPGNIQAENLPHLRNLVVVNNRGVDEPEDSLVQDVKSVIDWRETLVWREGGSEDKILSERRKSLVKDDVANLQFTSGTTGLPKAVSLTHSNLLNNGLSIGRCMRLTPADVLCNVPPLFHCFDKPTPLLSHAAHTYLPVNQHVSY
jgi:acyl-CoA synthetase (AMP-forming)/AMP-acid ligase II